MTKSCPDCDVMRLFEFEGGAIGWWAKGHHDPALFLDAVAWAQCVDGDHVPSDAHVPQIVDVCHVYWRVVPTPSPIRDGDWTGILVTARGPGRGAFPVTVVE